MVDRKLDVETLGVAAEYYAGTFMTNRAPLDRDWVMGQFFKFDFKDEFSIKCYKLESGTLVEILEYRFGVGEIDQIRVTHEETVPEPPPGSGVKQDPPWPGP